MRNAVVARKASVRAARAAGRSARIACGVASLLGCACANAESWEGKGEAGFVLSRGNSTATSANAKLDLRRDTGAWKYNVYGSYLFGRNATYATARRAEGRVQIDNDLTERAFWFAAGRYEDDAFSGFDFQTSVTAGAGYRFVDREESQVTVTLGAGYRRLRPETLVRAEDGDVVARIPGESEAAAVARATFDVDHELTETTRLVERLLVESGAGNTSVVNDLSLQVRMTESLALSLGYGVRFNTNPPNEARSTDQLTTLNLVYAIR
jgi:putative salt-induced outer membrane protein